MSIEKTKTDTDLEGHQLTNLGGLSGISVAGTNELINAIVTVDPSTGDGLTADIGSTAVIVSDGAVIAHYYKFGSGDNDWSQGAGPSGQSAGLTLWFNNPELPIALPTTGPTNTIAFVASPPSIIRTTGSWLDDGWAPTTKCMVSGSVSNNNGSWCISGVSATTLTLNSTAVLTPEPAGAGTITVDIDNEGLSVAPAAGVQVDESQTVTSADVNGVPIDIYTTEPLSPGALSVPVGTWAFKDYVYVDSTDTCYVKYQVSKVALSGVTTILFTTSASDIIVATSVLAPQEIDINYTVTSALPLLTTDRISVTPLFFSSSATPIGIHHVYQGSRFAGNILTTFGVVGAVGPL